MMKQVYQLFDRRCRTQTAADNLMRLRRRLKRFKKLGRALEALHGSNLVKALTYLDDKRFLGASNAAERGTRRFRKMRKTSYSVRTAEHIRQPFWPHTFLAAISTILGKSGCRGIADTERRTPRAGKFPARGVLRLMCWSSGDRACAAQSPTDQRQHGENQEHEEENPGGVKRVIGHKTETE
ncbi:hypothetical protein FRUB_05639 [Fimbriiglobus ruber]|uniref:Uncharacterized protein n=1 Tax=Fimbriiglobus ruber TaxID=1908690 RepID=A0A225DRH6_9BACT|nr:hypothetical protein FRUB_05639 [Fimbriiglobus ruber]